jgi:hypothetical protein
VSSVQTLPAGMPGRQRREVCESRRHRFGPGVEQEAGYILESRGRLGTSLLWYRQEYVTSVYTWTDASEQVGDGVGVCFDIGVSEGYPWCGPWDFRKRHDGNATNSRHLLAREICRWRLVWPW